MRLSRSVHLRHLLTMALGVAAGIAGLAFLELVWRLI
jgi:hypothetical protein